MARLRPLPESTPRLLSLSFLILIGLTFLALPSSARREQQQPQVDDDDDEVVRIDTELVVVNITVVDAAGRYVHGLSKSDFKLLEDGEEQRSISYFGDEETPFAAAILLDTSGSMERRVAMARAAAIRFLNGLRAEDVAAVYHFDSKVEQVQEFNMSRDLADTAFGLRAKGLTVLYDAIMRAAADISRRPEKRRAIVVLSDGGDTRSSVSMETALAAALAANATIYTVDMSSPAASPVERLKGAAALRTMANKSGGRYIASPGGVALREAFSSVVEELGNQYTITYKPSNRARDGRWRAIELKLATPNLTARTRKGYRAPAGGGGNK
ncbi:MAG TPA: VWA domain-containing protein [Pyrinomonadaceae bacterium]|jgi:Ca-activated chloride channel family protein|nr:VWA domain-containing protein [Pyrinomonadaceae bacterium]